MVIVSAILDLFMISIGDLDGRETMMGRRCMVEKCERYVGISGFDGGAIMEETEKTGNPSGKKKPVSEKSCPLGHRCSEFPMFGKVSLCSIHHMQAARQRMVERFSPEKVVSQHILPLLQRWHRGP